MARSIYFLLANDLKDRFADTNKKKKKRARAILTFDLLLKKPNPWLMENLILFFQLGNLNGSYYMRLRLKLSWPGQWVSKQEPQKVHESSKQRAKVTRGIGFPGRTDSIHPKIEAKMPRHSGHHIEEIYGTSTQKRDPNVGAGSESPWNFLSHVKLEACCKIKKLPLSLSLSLYPLWLIFR